jgi:hypothetical protein
MSEDYPAYTRLSAQKLSQISGPLFDGDYDLTDTDASPSPADEPKYCPRCGRYSVFLGSFDEVWYCENCDEF